MSTGPNHNAVGSRSKSGLDGVFESFDFKAPEPAQLSSVVFGTALETLPVVPIKDNPRVEFKKRQRWSALSAFSKASTLRSSDERRKDKPTGSGKKDETLLQNVSVTQTNRKSDTDTSVKRDSTPEEVTSGASRSSGGTTVKQRKEEAVSHRTKSSDYGDAISDQRTHSTKNYSSSGAATNKSLSINIDAASSNTSNSQNSKKEKDSEDSPQEKEGDTDLESAAVTTDWTPTKQEWFIMLSLSLISTVVALDSTILVTILPVSLQAFGFLLYSLLWEAFGEPKEALHLSSRPCFRLFCRHFRRNNSILSLCRYFGRSQEALHLSSTP